MHRAAGLYGNVLDVPMIEEKSLEIFDLKLFE